MIYFYKGKNNILENNKKNTHNKNSDKEEDYKNIIHIIQKEFSKVLDVQNLSFLIGAGCSSFLNKNDEEIGVPTMQPMAKEFYSNLSNEDKNFIKNEIKININDEQLEKNLEKFLEILYAYKFLLDNQAQDIKKISNLINKTKEFIFNKCNIKSKEVIEIYKKFYRKLLYRDNNLTKTNIFTTNYDIFNEIALEQLGVIYTNGFTGFIERYFNPSTFNYAYAEQLDLNNKKWNVIDNFIYLYKLHGSITWIEDETTNALFKIKEIQKPQFQEENNYMIYPTPMKQNSSFGSPYSDLFREFQKKLMQNNNVLVTIGYSFSDEHINNLIYQALTIPTFRLIIIGNYKSKNINKLFNLDDSRIWIIGEENRLLSKLRKMKFDHFSKQLTFKDFDYQWTEFCKKSNEIPLHFFNKFIDEIMPDMEEEKIEEKIKQISKLFMGQ
ncbi:conserved hypothetical protein [Lebetimonas natsushimae]|uniref:Uncharacterized protein n=1 Tax=Lebetimonas natsushimae TaxID=1936991 RepID=A0A292YH53_9BACT|nr:SIR2 family protein [Lebetimonas natsushimae]GAX88140.1 conserved hypothetical protein [Lebetimonas natsushimae]